eukprot:scaffold42576_cov54-Phaeocystis_antarctica.AAC.4
MARSPPVGLKSLNLASLDLASRRMARLALEARLLTARHEAVLEYGLPCTRVRACVRPRAGAWSTAASSPSPDDAASCCLVCLASVGSPVTLVAAAVSVGSASRPMQLPICHANNATKVVQNRVFKY